MRLPLRFRKQKKKRKLTTSRQTASLPTCREQVIACTGTDVWQQNGTETKVIGYNKRSTGCRAGAVFRTGDQARETCLQIPSREQGMMAHLTPGSSTRAWCLDGVIIDTVVNKYCDHSPLYRQNVALLRDAGIDINRWPRCAAGGNDHRKC